MGNVEPYGCDPYETADSESSLSGETPGPGVGCLLTALLLTGATYIILTLLAVAAYFAIKYLGS